MNLTSKSRYAVKIMIDFALHSDEKLQRHTISERMGIPGDYIDHILARLRDAGIIDSIRGRSGGFVLKKKPEEISMWEIFKAAEDTVYSVECIDVQGCSHSEYCLNKSTWDEIYGTIQHALEAKMLDQMAAVWKQRKDELPPENDEMRSRIVNCRAPKKGKVARSSGAE